MSLPNKDVKKKNSLKQRLASVWDRRWKRVLIIILCILLCFVLSAAGTFGILWLSGRKALLSNGTASITAPSGYDVEIDDDGVVRYNGEKYMLNENVTSVLVIGVDEKDVKGRTNGQADALYLVAIDTKSGKTTVIAVSRDIMAEVDTKSKDGKHDIRIQQICTAYAYGSDLVDSCENTVSSVSRLLYGVPINTYFSMKWKDIPVLTDSVGGVTVPGYDSEWNPTGKMITVSGDRALDYLQKRSKKTVEGNNNRMKRQIDYLKAFAAKTIERTKSDITVPLKLYNKLNRYSTNNIDASRITYLTTVFMDGGAQLEFVSIKGELIRNGNYAEMYVDEESLYETVLSVFYKKLSD